MPVIKLEKIKIKRKIPKNVFIFPKATHAVKTNDIYIYVNTKLFKPIEKENRFVLKNNGDFTIHYKNGYIGGTFDKISDEKSYNNMIKRFGKFKKPKRILKNIYFDDDKRILEFTYEGDWETQLKDRYKHEHVIKKFKIRFLKKYEYDKTKEFLEPFIELKNKYYQLIK